MKNLIIVFFCVSAIVMDATASECTAVIALSKIRTDVVQDSSSLETAARNFCKEYASAKNSGKTMNVGVSYSGLGASFGSGSVSAEQIASKYCDASDESKARSDAYRQYVETIAPGAFAAYERCEELSKSGVKISVEPASILPKNFKAFVSFSSDSSTAQQEIAYSASPGVSCTWDGTKKNKVVLTPNTSSSLSCERSNDSEKSAVLIFATSKANSQLAFQWDAYKNGAPVDWMKQLLSRVDQSVNAMTEATNSIKAGVVAFALNSCPTGWEEYSPLYGRFIRGMDRSTGTDPDGNRAIGSLQGDEHKTHTHTRPRDVYDAGRVGTGSVAGGTTYGYGFTGSGNGTAPDTGATGGPETRPKNVTLLYCLKK